MANNIEKIHHDLMELRRDVIFIKHILSEDLELSKEAKKALKKARKTPKSKYIDIDELD